MGDVPILMYHEVAERSAIESLARKIQRGYITEVEEFDQQLKLLRDRGFNFLTMAALVSALQDGSALPGQSIVITFDDGYEGNYKFARPILLKYGAVATFFVVSNKIGDPDMMSWDQLKAMALEGFEVQSHTANHPLLSTLDATQTMSELAESKAAIEAGVGATCEFLSLPNGDSNPGLREQAQACGYRGVCGSQFGFNGADADPFLLKRIAVKGGLGLRRFEAIVSREPALVRRMRFTATMKSTLAALLGKRRYDRLYNAFYGVAEQDRRKQL